MTLPVAKDSRPRNAETLRQDALRIWRAGVRAVQPLPLVLEAMHVADDALWLGGEPINLDSIERIAVVGGGKAAAGMAVAVEQVLGPVLLREKRVTGWVNVPADCIVPTDRVTLHAARPAGVNEPTEAGVAGVREMLRLLGELGPHDLCLCLISGGGSALLPAPVEGFSLADKVELTRAMSAAGASIDQMNLVRRELSTAKGGGIARACRAGRLISLILSDVPGDDLSVVAAGPTVETEPAPREAAAALRSLGLGELSAARRAVELLESRQLSPQPDQPTADVRNILIGNNAAAVDAAGIEAERLGYSHAMISATASEGPAETVAEHLVATARRMREQSGPDCLISGGEPTVTLAAESIRGRGGRNQQLCLAALAELEDWSSLALVSGGTDGEDGPTDAAGACVDEAIAVEARRLKLDASDYLARNDAYHFFAAAGGLLVTGPTQTNVCDLRVITSSRL
jgi:glycerate 2-kinase